jgi:hypothetical protein
LPVTRFGRGSCSPGFAWGVGHLFAHSWRVADWAGTSERMIEEIYRHRLTRVSDLGSVKVPVWPL